MLLYIVFVSSKAITPAFKTNTHFFTIEEINNIIGKIRGDAFNTVMHNVRQLRRPTYVYTKHKDLLYYISEEVIKRLKAEDRKGVHRLSRIIDTIS